jgi:hypothetical protein
MSKSGNFLFLGAQDGAATGCYAGVAVNHWEILDHLAGRPRSTLDAEEAEMENPWVSIFILKMEDGGDFLGKLTIEYVRRNTCGLVTIRRTTPRGTFFY